MRKHVLMAFAAAAVPLAMAAGQATAAAAAPQPKPMHAAGVVHVSPKASGSAKAVPVKPFHQRSFQPKLSSRAITTPTIPFFQAQFTYKGKTYHYTSAGTNPRRSTAATTVPVTFIPVKIVESDGSFSYPTGAVNQTTGSALFHTSTATHGNQYGDDTLRSSYWSYVKAHGKRWHVRLGTPSTTSLQTLNVPSDQGTEIGPDGNNDFIMLVNANWLAGELDSLSANYSAKRLVAFLTYDVVACDDFTNLNTCGIGGFHSDKVTGTGTHTYSWASWQDPTVFGANGADTVAMTHEIAEWLNDPFVNDHVPAWSVPSEPQYGCSSFFEVGDPLVGHVFTINGLHYQDEANFSWFARQKPSVGRNGWYSYRGTFKNFSPHC